MDKYTLLIIFNSPFVLFGLVKAAELYRRHVIGNLGVLLRVAFWGAVLTGLVFAQPAYDYLARQNLTDSAPLSLADVVLVTGLNFALFLCMRLYTKVDILERRVSDLQEKISIELSAKNK